MAERLELPDDIQAISDEFARRRGSDGLPIVPPTPERVEAMLAATRRAPDEQIALVPPAWGRATVEMVAVNAVMAGCRPEYLPILITTLEAMGDPAFNLRSIQTTTHPCAPLLVVSGPAARQAGVWGGAGCFGPGFHANATIGRAVRLMLMNLGGALPGDRDRATQGQPSKYAYCIAENEAESPWEPLHVERGLPRWASAVTVVGAEANHNINDHSSTTARDLLTTICDAMCTIGMNNIYYPDTNPVLALGPEHAHVIAGDGWSKADVKYYIWEHARAPKKLALSGGMYTLREWPKWLEEGPDGDSVPICRRPDDILVIVAGGKGRHSSCIPTFGATRAVTREVPL